MTWASGVPKSSAKNSTWRIQFYTDLDTQHFEFSLFCYAIKVRPHYTTLQNATHCSFATRQKLSTWKKNFLQTFFRLPKLWNEIGELGLIFVSNWLISFWNPLRIICHVAFDGTDSLPIEFLGHAASNGMPQPSRRNVHIYLWYGTTFATRLCYTLPLCAAWRTWHSMDVPLK